MAKYGKCTFCMTIKSSSSFDQSTAITRNFIICLIPEIPRDIVFIPSILDRVQRWRVS